MVYDPNRDIVLGHEFVGDVVGHGPDCSDEFPIGTRVTAMPILLIDGGVGGTKVIGQHPEAPGSFGELLVVSEVMARAVPDGVSADAVALVDAFAVGEFYVRSSNIEPGEIPLVIGAGAIGLSAVAALKRRDIEPIVVSDFKPERRALAEQFGAHVVVDPAEQQPFAAWKELAIERWCTKPAVVFECVGAPGTHATARRLVRDVDADLRAPAAGTPATRSTAPRPPTRASRSSSAADPIPRTGTARSTRSAKAGSTRSPASARSSASTRSPPRST